MAQAVGNPAVYNFCTYFDRHYLPRGVALYRSLKEHCPAFQLWILCMDDESFDVLSQLNLSNIHLIALGEFESGDRELLRAKESRSRIEYYFTCTPSLPVFVLENHPEVGEITYLDADLFFFANPAAIYTEIANQPVAIVGHRFPPILRGNEKYGLYNVGWLSFKRDPRAFSCLLWWRERCIEWCYDRVESGRFADQKYLDDWPTRFPGVVVIRHPGANLAAWNLANYAIETEESRVLVDKRPLIFFHFHGFRQIKPWLYDPNLAIYKVRPSRVVLRSIYAPYITALQETERQVAPLLATVSSCHGIRDRTASAPQVAEAHRTALLEGMLRASRFVLNQSYIFALHGRVL